MSSPDAQQTRPPQDDAPDPARWRALAVCLVAGFMTLLDISIVNVALPSVREGLDASASDLQWVVSGYALSFGLLLVPAGRIGDARGRRPAFQVGLAVFTVASLLCGLAPGAGLLIAARLLQGLGGGILTPQVSGLIQALFSGAERGRAFGLLGTTIGVSTAVGPLTGGLIIKALGSDLGWRFVFFVNLPVGLVALVLAQRLIPHHPRRGDERETDLDPVGVVLLGLGVVAFLLPFIEEQQWHGSAKWLLVVLALVLLAVFALWEARYGRRGGQPVVDLSLFRERGYSLGAALGLLYFAGFTGIFFTFTLYLQQGLGFSALAAGAAITPFALGSAVASAVAGPRTTRSGRPLVLAGLLLVLVGLVACWVAVDLEPGRGVVWAALVPLLLAGLGSGLVISPNQTLTLAEVPVRRAGVAGGVLQTGQRMGAAAGIALTGSVFFSRVASSRGDYAHAFRTSLYVIAGFVLLSAVLATADVVVGRRSAEPA